MQRLWAFLRGFGRVMSTFIEFPFHSRSESRQLREEMVKLKVGGAHDERA